jgi:hypothetical protein
MSLTDTTSNGGRSPRTWSVERWLLVISVVISSFAFTFGLGVNWADIRHTEARVQAVEADRRLNDSRYVPREVYQSDQRRLTEAIDRLTRAIERQ